MLLLAEAAIFPRMRQFSIFGVFGFECSILCAV